jgi:hypothetical protein
MSPIIQWGPALLVLLGILLGVLYNNRSITHLDTRVGDSYQQLSAQIGDSHQQLSARIDDLNRHEEARHNDLKDFFKSEIRRLEERIARLEQPIIRS